MSRMVDTEITVTIDGDERDVPVRGFVTVEPGLGMGGGMGAALDGDPMVWIGHDRWCPLDSVNVDDSDRERIEEALCAVALEDDSDGEEADEDYYDDWCADADAGVGR